MANKFDVVSKKACIGKNPFTGVKMNWGTAVKSSDGSQRILLTPAGKSAKYAAELKQGVHLTNTGEVKTNRQGKERRLTDTEAAFRSGYLGNSSDSAKAFKSINGGNK